MDLREDVQAAAQAATVEVAEAAEATKDREVQTVAAAMVDASPVVDAEDAVAMVAMVDSQAKVAQMAGTVIRAPQEALAASKADVAATAHLEEVSLKGSRPLVDLTVVEAAEEALDHPAMAAEEAFAHPLAGEEALALVATEDREVLALR